MNFFRSSKIRKILAIFFAIVFLLIVNSNLSYKSSSSNVFDSRKINDYMLTNTSLELNNEWEELNEAFLIRIPTAIYLIDASQINVLIITESQLKTRFTCYLKIKNNQKLIKLNYSLKKLDGNSRFGVFLLDIKHTLPGNEKYNNVYSLVFFDENRKTRARREIPLKVKKKSSDVKNTGLCSDFYILDESYFENFKWWIEINKHFGYKKLIFHKHSIPQENYNELFEKHKDFVVVKPYTYMPNMREKSFEYIYPTKMSEVPNYGIHELIAYNECVMDHFDEFKRIAVFDADEFIIPKADCTLEKYNFSSNLCDTGVISNEICGESSIDGYLDRLRDKNYQLNGSFSYFFPFIGALHNEYIDSLFSVLASELSKTSYFLKKIRVATNNKKDDSKNFEMFINDQDEFDYAKYLLKSYVLYAKKYDYFNKKDDIVFNRMFLLKYITNGKCIHEFETFYPVWHHGNMANIKTLRVPFERGYVVHFRKQLNYDNKYKNFSITKLSIDLNYLNCYLKDISKIISN
jgi:hypothetical protein